MLSQPFPHGGAPPDPSPSSWKVDAWRHRLPAFDPHIDGLRCRSFSLRRGESQEPAQVFRIHHFDISGGRISGGGVGSPTLLTLASHRMNPMLGLPRYPRPSMGLTASTAPQSNGAPGQLADQPGSLSAENAFADPLEMSLGNRKS